jgi:hypothetical protein
MGPKNSHAQSKGNDAEAAKGEVRALTAKRTASDPHAEKRLGHVAITSGRRSSKTEFQSKYKSMDSRSGSCGCGWLRTTNCARKTTNFVASQWTRLEELPLKPGPANSVPYRIWLIHRQLIPLARAAEAAAEVGISRAPFLCERHHLQIPARETAPCDRGSKARFLAAKGHQKNA